MAERLFTVGYEGLAQRDVLQALSGAGVALLVDVRAVSASRRAGFAKSALKAGAATVGIDYLHLRALGTPAAGRLAAREGRIGDLRRIYAEALAGTEAQAELAQLRARVRERVVCLICYERDPQRCHRTLIAEALGLATQHLLA